MAADALTSPPVAQLVPRRESTGEHDKQGENFAELSRLPDLQSLRRTQDAVQIRDSLYSHSHGPSLFHSQKRPSKSLTLEPSTQSQGSLRTPLLVFKNLLDLLLLHHVPGPSLYRTRTEYNKHLGGGRTFEVLGASHALLELRASFNANQSAAGFPSIDASVQSTINDIPRVAIKRAYVDNHNAMGQASQSLDESLTRAFGHQLVCVEREIENLCHPGLYGHPNIIKILGWGLCLDTLEDPMALEPRVPLLVLERADFTLGQLIDTEELACRHGHCQTHHPQLAILKDIGRGLDAIHGAGLIHGDIKLENILIFRNVEGYTAKLSDFGLTIAAYSDGESDKLPMYRGTPRWCPPAGSTWYKHQDLFAFDHFAYGLVAWCIFASLCHSPLPPEGHIDPENEEQYAASRILETCISQVSKRHSVVPLPVQLCLRACLHSNPIYWRHRPWKSLDGITCLEAKAFNSGCDILPRKLKALVWNTRVQTRCSTPMKVTLTALLNSSRNIGNIPLKKL
jgi:serine/threonine protein kinase